MSFDIANKITYFVIQLELGTTDQMLLCILVLWRLYYFKIECHMQD